MPDTVVSQIDDASLQTTAAVVGSRIDGHRLSDVCDPTRLVDVAMQCEQRPKLFDQPAFFPIESKMHTMELLRNLSLVRGKLRLENR